MMTLTMDKNKAAHKLQNIPPIYYLNIDGQPERRKYVEEHFKYWEIENYTRISAYAVSYTHLTLPTKRIV